MKSNAVYLRSYVSHKSSTSIVYEIDSNVKFSLTCDKDKVLYAKNPHYGWQLCTEAQTLNFLIDRVIWRFNSMAIPGFQEQLESRIKNYFLCTVRLVRGYRSKNYFIPP